MESRTFSTRACIGQCVRKYSDYVIRVCNIETSNLEPQEEQRLRMLLLSSGFAAVISFLMGSISYNIDTAFRPTHTVIFGASVIYLFIPILFRLTKDVFIGLMVFAALSWAVVFLIAFYAYGLPSPVLSGFFCADDHWVYHRQQKSRLVLRPLVHPRHRHLVLSSPIQLLIPEFRRKSHHLDSIL